MPSASREALIIAAANDLTAALQNTDDNPLVPPIGTQTQKQLKEHAQAFQDALPSLKPTAPTSTPAAQQPVTKLTRDDSQRASRQLVLQSSNETIKQTMKSQRTTRTEPRVAAEPRVQAEQSTHTKQKRTTKVLWRHPIATTHHLPAPALPTTFGGNQPTTKPSPIVLTFLRNTKPPTNSHGQTLRRGKRQRRPNRFLVTDPVLNAVLNPETGKLEENKCERMVEGELSGNCTIVPRQKRQKLQGHKYDCI